MVEQYRQSVFLEKYAVFTLATKSLFSMTLKKRRKLVSFSLTFFFKTSRQIYPFRQNLKVWKYDSGFEAFKYYRAALVSDVCFLNFETPLERKVIFSI